MKRIMFYPITAALVSALIFSANVLVSSNHKGERHEF